MQLYEWLSNVASDQSSAKALVYRDTYLSWRGLLHRVDRRAQELHALGIAPGAWVGLMLGNVPDFVILALALSKIDAVVVPLDPTTGNRELEMILEAAPLRALITRPRGGEGGQASAGLPYYASPTAARPAAGPPSKFVPESRRRLQGTLLTCGLYKRTSLAALADGPAAPDVVQLTASIGGDPKGVVKTSANLEAAAQAIGKTLGVSASDRILCTLPLHASYGFDFGLLTTLASGATLFLEDEVSPKRIAKLLREQSIDFFAGTPALYGSLVRVPTVKPLKTAGARFLSSGSTLPANIAEGFYQRFGIRLLSCYHSTQAGPLALDRGGKDPESVGKSFDGVELRVAGPKGDRLPPSETGPIWVRSRALSVVSVPKTHLPKRSDGVPIGGLDDGWLRTGDVGQQDKTGRTTITGREDDLVKVDGKRVALGEVEGCLEAFPKVKAAQARVITDDLGGPMVVARVVRAGVCRAEDIIDHCARNLAPYKVPRQIEFCEQLG
jgi:long-chain acyl-CoA synthetase